MLLLEWVWSSDQISDRDAVRWGGIIEALGDSQGDLRWSVETNRMLRHPGAVVLCAHNPEVAGLQFAEALLRSSFHTGGGRIGWPLWNCACSLSLSRGRRMPTSSLSRGRQRSVVLLRSSARTTCSSWATAMACPGPQTRGRRWPAWPAISTRSDSALW